MKMKSKNIWMLMILLIAATFVSLLGTPVEAQEDTSAYDNYFFSVTQFTTEPHVTTRWTDMYESPNGPSTGIALAPNTPVNVNNRDGSGNWANISADSGSGWVPSNALSATDAPPPPSDGAQTIRWTDVYDAPNGNRTGDALPPATPVGIVEYNDAGNWVNITSSIANGWVPASAIDGDAGTPPPPPPPPPDDPPPPPDDDPTPPDDGSLLVGIEFGASTSHTLDSVLTYANLPDDYVPWIAIFDPDNCLGTCGDGTIAITYPIKGLYLNPDEVLPRSGSLSIQIAIDNLLCVYEPVTTRFVVAIGDYGRIDRGELTVPIDDIFEVPFSRSWCD